jgi:hypothetical protein
VAALLKSATFRLSRGLLPNLFPRRFRPPVLRFRCRQHEILQEEPAKARRQCQDQGGRIDVEAVDLPIVLGYGPLLPLGMQPRP